MSEKITYEDKEIISTGSFITLGLGETIIDLDYGDDGIRIILNFVHSEEKEGYTKEVESIDKATMRITFTNYKLSLGLHLTEPWNIGTISNKKLYLVYRISHLQNTEMNQIDYSFYIGEEGSNGQS